MARWFRAQGQATSAKNTKTYPNYDINKKPKIQNFTI